ncbi:23S rRNA (adenine(2503)-C(2))-methyltransferase RlmN [bacterium]|nr:MAG: 23S rRNA (adenine(2503)-C(2))-methyltransferase RlmN [bacterium]
MKNIKELNLEELKALFKSWGEPEFHALQVLRWVYEKAVLDFDRMTNISVALRNKLKSEFKLLSLKLLDTKESYDGTKKLLLELEDKNLIEAVIIPAEKRITGCVSTQVGCKFACRFCASGLSGFKRNLDAADILDEVVYLKNNSLNKELTHLVFMGMGEPLDNYDNLMRAIRIINSKDGLNIGSRRITISTCGVVPGIKKLAEERLQIELSISLHSADDKIRSVLMPVNKVYPLRNLISACKHYIQNTNRQITFEYIMLKGINSDLRAAEKLAGIMEDLRLCKVNLIPFNPVREMDFESPGKMDVLLFKDYLLKRGLNVTLRKERGRDIDAACGELRLRYVKK